MVQINPALKIFRRNQSVHVRRLQLLRLPNFRRLALGQFFSQAVDASTTILTAQFVFFSSTNGPTTSLLMQSVISASLPLFIAGPLSGILADRCSRKTILVRGQVARAAVVLALFVAGIVGSKFLALLFFGCGLCVTKVMYTTRVSTIRHLVRQHELVAADSFLLILGNFSAAVGGVIGVLSLQLFEFGGFGTVIVGHLIGAMQFKRINVNLGGGREHNVTPWKEISRNFRASKTKYAFISVGSHRLLYGVSFACLALLIDSHQSNSYAAMVGAAGLGTFLGNLSSEWVNEHLPRKSTTVLVFSFSAFILFGCSFRPTLSIAMATITSSAFLFQNLRVCSDATVQRNAPRGAGGRVLASYDFVCNTSFLMGLLLGLACTTRLGTAAILGCAVMGYFIMAILLGLLDRSSEQNLRVELLVPETEDADLVELKRLQEKRFSHNHFANDAS